ncbi:MAG: hypothetical protein GVY19_07670 [Bacteroidetes bacterium]|jgi:hypothetical protein|nr:hypothetical protein [Bacteroidota bacterium]
MRKNIIITGTIAVILATISALLKLYKLPFANITLMMAIAVYVAILFPQSIIEARKTKSPYFILIILGGISAAFSLTGTLFSLMHWPYRYIVLTMGIVMPIVLFLPIFIYQYAQHGSIHIKHFMAVLGIFLFFSLTDAFLSLNISKNAIDGAVQVEREFTISNNILSMEIKTLNAGNENNEIQKITEKANRINEEIASIKNAIDKKYLDANRNIHEILSDDQYGTTLRNALNTFHQAALPYDIQYNQWLDVTNLKENQHGNIPWTHANFYGKTTIQVLNRLSEIEYYVNLTALAIIKQEIELCAQTNQN